jgi:hypothetical protein
MTCARSALLYAPCACTLLFALAGKLKRNDKAMQNYKRMYMAPPEMPPTEENSPLLTNSVYKHIQVSSTPGAAHVHTDHTNMTSLLNKLTSQGSGQ